MTELTYGNASLLGGTANNGSHQDKCPVILSLSVDMLVQLSIHNA